MKYLLVGFFMLSLWLAAGSYFYTCKVKYLCADNQGFNPSSNLDEPQLAENQADLKESDSNQADQDALENFDIGQSTGMEFDDSSSETSIETSAQDKEELLFSEKTATESDLKDPVEQFNEKLEIDPQVTYENEEIVKPEYEPVKESIKESKQTIVTEKAQSDDLFQALKEAMPKVQYSYGDSKATAQFERQEFINLLQQYFELNDRARLRLTGHTCNISSDSFNYRLGLKRAKVIKEKMVALGVNSDKVEVASKGKHLPAFDNSTAEGRKLNRRVTFDIVN